MFFGREIIAILCLSPVLVQGRKAEACSAGREHFDAHAVESGASWHHHAVWLHDALSAHIELEEEVVADEACSNIPAAFQALSGGTHSVTGLRSEHTETSSSALTTCRLHASVIC